MVVNKTTVPLTSASGLRLQLYPQPSVDNVASYLISQFSARSQPLHARNYLPLQVALNVGEGRTQTTIGQA